MVPEVLSMTKAMTCHKNDDHLRKQLIKSYVGAKIPAFDKFLFTDADDFEGLLWVMRAGIHLEDCNLHLIDMQQEGSV